MKKRYLCPCCRRETDFETLGSMNGTNFSNQIIRTTDEEEKGIEVSAFYEDENSEDLIDCWDSWGETTTESAIHGNYATTKYRCCQCGEIIELSDIDDD